MDATIVTQILDCPVCSKPLSPPVLQCPCGHFICSRCHGDQLPGSKCHSCPRTSFERSRAMERVLDSIIVPCSYAKHGCADKVAYHLREEHERACPAAPCFCPDSGCGGFAGPPSALLDHIKAAHKQWPLTVFRDNVPFDLPVEAGLRVLHEKEDGHVFVVNVAFAEHIGHGVSLVSVQHNGAKARFVCSASAFSKCNTGRYHASALENVGSSSLSDGLPTRCFFTVPYMVLTDVLVIVMAIYKTYDDYDGDSNYDDDDDDYNDYQYDEDESNCL